MGLAIDTAVYAVTNPGATPSNDNTTAATGDSKTVRNFAQSGKAGLEFISRQGTTAGFVRVMSPRMHDVSKGLTYLPGETPAARLFPFEVEQPLYSGDSLQITVSGGTAEADAAALGIYYTDLPGSDAKLKMLADVVPNLVNLKSVEIDVTQSGTAFTWVDAAITTTENLLKADTWYAVLGFDTDTAALVIGVKGPETANLRIGGPGPTSTIATNDYFIRQSQATGKPFIPVFNANNRAAYFVCLNCLAISGTTKVSLELAELAGSFSA
jgi:hypothetical protein